MGFSASMMKFVYAVAKMRYRAVSSDITTTAFIGNVWHLYRKGCVCNYSVAVERTAKPLWYDNRPSVGTDILEGRECS